MLSQVRQVRRVRSHTLQGLFGLHLRPNVCKTNGEVSVHGGLSGLFQTANFARFTRFTSYVHLHLQLNVVQNNPVTCTGEPGEAGGPNLT